MTDGKLVATTGSDLGSGMEPQAVLVWIHVLGKTQEKRIVGSLVYLVTCTWYHIAHRVQQLAHFVSKPAKVHMQSAKRELLHLRRATDFSIFFKKESFNSVSNLDASFLKWSWTLVLWLEFPFCRADQLRISSAEDFGQRHN